MKQVKIIAIALFAIIILAVFGGCSKTVAQTGNPPIGTPTISNTGNKVVDSLSEKYYANLSSDADFVGGELLLVVSRQYGSINQVHSLSEMATVIKDEYLQKVNGRYELTEEAKGLSFDELTEINQFLLENIVELEDLSWISGDIDALGINRETYKQILKLTLKSVSKDETLELLHLLEKNPILESVEPNFIIVWDD